MNEKRFKHGLDRLRAPERVAMLEVEQVVKFCCGDIVVNSVLDVGTGTGLFAEAFAAKGLIVFGVDVNQEMVAAAKEFVPTGIFRQAPAEALPHEDDLVDLAFLGHVLHEVNDPQLALQEAARVARRRVAILEWPYEEQLSGPPLQHRLKVEEVISLARQAGFRNISQPALSHMALYLLDS